jgi:hypothetical protein
MSMPGDDPTYGDVPGRITRRVPAATVDADGPTLREPAVTHRLEFSEPADITQQIPVDRDLREPRELPDEDGYDDRPAVPVKPPEPRRTRRPWRFDVGRRMRSVAGVDEALLDRVPQERARYTALGGVVIGTALIASFSMFFAITEALGKPSGWIVIPTVIWGLFIFNFDRWLISSAMGLRWHRRYGTLIMRVLMAVLFGVIIAEPLVLRVFQTAIVKNIQDQRTADLDALQSKLVSCNPETNVPGGKVPPGCAGYVLTFPSTPGSVAGQLALKRSDEAKLSAEVATDTKQLASLNDQARMECVGISGPGRTGQRGVGPNCKRLRAEADAYAKAHPIAKETAALATLQTQISTLEAQVTTAQGDFEKQRTDLIAARLAAERSHQGSIGILERMGALSKLAHSSTTLFIGVWAVRLLFILIDCMPILVKFFGGITTYDRLVDRELTNADADHAADLEIGSDERQARVRRRRDEIDIELREHRAHLGSRVSRAVHDLATEYIEPSPPARSGALYASSSGREGTHSAGVVHDSGRAPARGGR